MDSSTVNACNLQLVTERVRHHPAFLDFCSELILCLNIFNGIRFTLNKFLLSTKFLKSLENMQKMPAFLVDFEKAYGWVSREKLRSCHYLPVQMFVPVSIALQ